MDPAFALAFISLLNSTRNETFRNHHQIKRSTEFESYINQGVDFNHDVDPRGIFKPLDTIFSKKIERDSCFDNLNFYRSNFENKDGELKIYRPGFLQKCDKTIYEFLLNDKNVISNFKTIVFDNISKLTSYEYYQ